MFNAAQLHLAINHFPIVGSIIASLILLYSLIFKDHKILKFSLVLVFLIGLSSIPAFLSGEPAEDIIENLAGVSKSVIEKHEEAAELGLIFSLVAGLLALTSLFLEKMQIPFFKKAVIITLIACLSTNGMMAWVAHLGGKIRHPEISQTENKNIASEVEKPKEQK